MLEMSINVCIGTDGAASNNTLNLFKEIHLISLIHKGINEDAECITAYDAFKFATQNGAKAFGIQEEIGILEEGMKADLVLIDIDKPQFYPRNNMISALAYSTSGEEVDTVIVDGKVLMEGKVFTTIDVEKVKYHVNRISSRINKRR